MLFIFSTPELIRNLWHLKTAVLLHWDVLFHWLFGKKIPEHGWYILMSRCRLENYE